MSGGVRSAEKNDGDDDCVAPVAGKESSVHHADAGEYGHEEGEFEDDPEGEEELDGDGEVERYGELRSQLLVSEAEEIFEADGKDQCVGEDEPHKEKEG